MPDLLIVVPSRGRPENIKRVISAWDFTNAWDHADLALAADADDRYLFEYQEPGISDRARLIVMDKWMPMVAKLNATAVAEAGDYWAVGFAGDDHVPRTRGWAGRYLDTLRRLGTGIVYGDDGHRGEELPTQWAMTADIIRALGAMVPAPVEHQFCDRAVLDLGEAAGCIRYLPDVLIEHMHYAVGKSAKDPGYERVNTRQQFAADEAVWRSWHRDQLPGQAAVLRALRGGAGAGG